MTTISDSLHWQPSLTNDDNIVTGFADVEQAIRIILNTSKGAVPHRPEFGCDVPKLIDGNYNDVVPLFIARATEAILRFEPRVERLKITAEQYDKRQGYAGATFNITWTPIDGLVPQNMIYRI